MRLLSSTLESGCTSDDCVFEDVSGRVYDGCVVSINAAAIPPSAIGTGISYGLGINS